MLKKVILLLVSILLFASSVGFAQETQSVLVLLSGSLNRIKSWDQDVYTNTTKRFQQTFLPNYTLLIGSQYKKRLDDMGMSDAGSMEGSDLIAGYKDLNLDYIIIYNFSPLLGGTLFSSRTSEVHLKVIDVKQNMYIMNKKFTYKSTWATIDGHYEQIYSDIEKDIFSKLFPLITLQIK